MATERGQDRALQEHFNEMSPLFLLQMFVAVVSADGPTMPLSTSPPQCICTGRVTHSDTVWQNRCATSGAGP